MIKKLISRIKLYFQMKSFMHSLNDFCNTIVYYGNVTAIAESYSIEQHINTLYKKYNSQNFFIEVADYLDSVSEDTLTAAKGNKSTEIKVGLLLAVNQLLIQSIGVKINKE